VLSEAFSIQVFLMFSRLFYLQKSAHILRIQARFSGFIDAE